LIISLTEDIETYYCYIVIIRLLKIADFFCIMQNFWIMWAWCREWTDVGAGGDIFVCWY